MVSLNDHLLYQLQKEHHQELIRETEKERMIRDALFGQVTHASFYRRPLCWLGVSVDCLGVQPAQAL